MILKRWAEELTAGDAVPEEAVRAVNLHVADTATAFFAGFQTSEGVALARFFTGDDAAKALAERQVAAVASIIRHTECDDIHVASCVTPGAAVVPVALALAGDTHRAERAIAAGYATGVRLGMALGGNAALAKGIWPSYFAAPLMAAATASVCLGLDARRTACALALAAAGAGGRVGRISTTPSGRWLAFGEAVARGCNAAAAAAAGFQGDPDLVSGDWLAAMASGVAVQPDALTAGSILDGISAVGFKPFVAARQTINAVYAFQTVLEREGISAEAIDKVEVGVPTINAAMIARPPLAGDRLSTISNMAVQIAAAAVRPSLLHDVERRDVPDAELAAFARRVTVVADPELDAFLPHIWAGKVCVTAGGREVKETCLSMPGDHAATAEPVIREKLTRMVPERHRDICAAQMAADKVGRTERRRSLWQAMLGALRAR